MNETSTPNNKTVKAVVVFPRIGSSVTGTVYDQIVTISGGMKLFTSIGEIEINPSEVACRAWSAGNGYNYDMKDGRGISIFW